ncbi:dihydrofolate reductase family protein [Hymenobacter lucidus]|uniref:Dihydrofolate reductase family protein n=1 Tax=Hymenobacter lucidus TaxID=2880930 RepID=A0ABS8AKV7_9BACT|nr:dihydrofolate reductase family protein [Hymenobacter lucidus]MCB2406845.1 dihydrofolate reductase family protein [Hymenobacter lucidus]
MRRLIVSEFVSLDGVMENPAWTLRFHSAGQAQFKLDELLAADALLMGRRTYEGFAAAWPTRTDEQGLASRMNSLPKYVVSATLREPAWHNTQVLSGGLAEEITQLKAQPGQDILVYGSARLVRALLQLGLADEYRLMVFPIVVGSGQRLFADDSAATLRLTGSRTFSSGVVLLTYQPGPPPAAPGA